MANTRTETRGRAPRRRHFTIAALTALGLLGVEAIAASAAYPGKNGRIAFENTRAGVAQDVFTVKPDGSGARNLTDSGTTDFDPAYSANGRLIAFHSDRRGGNNDIYVMRTDGTKVRRLTGAGGQDRDPYFAPGGGKVVFERDTGADTDIYSVRLTGTGLRNVTQSPMTTDLDPAYSPNGKRIVFSSDRTSSPMFGKTFNIVTMNANGTSQTPIAATFLTQESDPDFSPNGRQIVYASDTDGSGFPDELYRVRPNGTGKINLTKTFGATKDEWHPSYSPDGKRIVFLNGDADTSAGDVFTTSRRAQGRRAVYRRGTSTGPTWGPRP
jgi:TolB protein